MENDIGRDIDALASQNAFLLGILKRMSQQIDKLTKRVDELSDDADKKTGTLEAGVDEVQKKIDALSDISKKEREELAADTAKRINAVAHSLENLSHNIQGGPELLSVNTVFQPTETSATNTTLRITEKSAASTSITDHSSPDRKDGVKTVQLNLQESEAAPGFSSSRHNELKSKWRLVFRAVKRKAVLNHFAVTDVRMRPHDTVFKRIDKIERAMSATKKQFQTSSRALREKEDSVNKFDDRINKLDVRITNVERAQHKLIDRVDLFEVEMQTSVNQQVAIMNEVGTILQGGGGVSSNGIRHRIGHEAVDNDVLILVEERLKIMEDSKGQSSLNYDKLQEAHNEAKSSIEQLKSSAATNGTLVEDLRQQLAKMDQIASYRYNVHDKALQVHTATHVNQELFLSNMAEVTGMVAKIRFAFSEAISELYKIKADRRDLAKVLSCKEEYGMPMIVKGPDSKLQAELTWTSVPEFDPSGRPSQPRKLLTQSSGKKIGKSPIERVLQLGSPAWSPALRVPENPDVNVVFDKTLRDSSRSPSPQPDVYEKDSQRRLTKPKNTTKARPASAHSRPSQLRNEVNRTILSDTKRSNTRRSCSEAKAVYQNSNPSTPTTGLINSPEITANLELSSYLQQYSGRSDGQTPGRKNISAKYTTSSRDKSTNGRNHKWT